MTCSLGRTGLSVSRIGIGLAAVGRPAYITLGRDTDLAFDRTPDALAARSMDILDAAREAGIRHVDVARSYGRAEEFLARWLRARAIPREAITVSSKWGYRYTAGWRLDARVHEEKELSLARFTAQLAETRALLGTWLDVYQIHSATVESGCFDDLPLLQALIAARRTGACRAIGVTLSGPTSARALARVVEARVEGEPVFDTVQATLNCLEPSLREPLAAAHHAGLGIIVKESLANGRLTETNGLAADAALVAELGAVAATRGCTIDQLALAWVLEQPFVDVVLSGAATTAQLASHVGALGVRLDDEARGLLARVAEPPEEYWAKRGRLPWS